MEHIFLDSSVYIQDPYRTKAGFKTLVLLCEARRIQLHVPYIVKNEVISHLVSDQNKIIKEAKEGIDRIMRMNLQGAESKTLSSASDLFANLSERWPEKVSKEFDAFIQRTNAEENQILPHHGEEVIDYYFSGKHPFKAKKNRNDFPDAFIWQAILDILKRYGKLNVIIQDKGLAEACSNNSSVNLFDSIDPFLKSLPEEILNLGRLTADETNQLQKDLHKYNKFIERTIAGQLDQKIHGHKFEDESIPSDNGEATVLGLYSPDINIKYDEIENYGDGTYMLNFSASGDAEIEYYIFKGEFYTLAEERQARIGVTNHNSHYYEAGENVKISMEGCISIGVTKMLFDEFAFEQEADIQIEQIDKIILSETLRL